MNSRVACATMFLCGSLALVALVSIPARGPAYADPDDSRLPPVFRVGATVVGVAATGGPEQLTVLETRGKWVRAQASDGQILWLAPESWVRWLDSARPLDATSGQAMTQLAEFGESIDRWKRARRSLPNSLEDLTQQDPATGKSYIESGRIPLDPWGKAYVYRVIDATRLRYVITSPGPDHLMDTDDDVYYPERAPK